MHRDATGGCLSVRYLLCLELFSFCEMLKMFVALLLLLSHKFQHWMLRLG